MYTYRFSIDGVVDLDPVNPFTKRDVGNIFSVFFVDGGYADQYQVKDVPHGDMITTWYHSNRLQADRRLSVYLPPFYGKENKSYPVFYLLHGSGGDETAWVELGNVARIAYGHGDGSAGIGGFHAPLQAVGGGHGDTAHHVVTDVLGDLSHDHPLAQRDLDGAEQLGQLVVGETNVKNRTLNLDHGSFVVGHWGFNSFI